MGADAELIVTGERLDALLKRLKSKNIITFAALKHQQGVRILLDARYYRYDYRTKQWPQIFAAIKLFQLNGCTVTYTSEDPTFADDEPVSDKLIEKNWRAWANAQD